MLAYFAAGLLLRRAYSPPCLPNYALLKSIAQTSVRVKVFSRVLDSQIVPLLSVDEEWCMIKSHALLSPSTPEDEINDTLALVAEGDRINGLVRAKGHKEDTIIDWIRKAGQHAEAIEEVLLSEYWLTRGQIDGLWAYVGNKGEKKLS